MGNIGIIVPDLTSLFVPEIIKGAQGRAREAGYFAFVAGSAEDPKAEHDLVVQLSRRVDGIILCSSRMTGSYLRSLEGATRFVFINRDSGGAPSVFMDAATGAHQVVEHLLAFGHRSIAYLGGPAVSWSNRERRNAIRSHLKRAGAQLVEFGPFLPSFEAGVQGADFAVANRASGISAFNDVMAFGVLSLPRLQPWQFPRGRQVAPRSTY
jgi:DNA-binding LacI/PurR family transcriptional regulator